MSEQNRLLEHSLILVPWQAKGLDGIAVEFLVQQENAGSTMVGMAAVSTVPE